MVAIRYVTITQSEYDRLTQADNTLAALEAGGVDNWEGYETSLEALNEDQD